MNKSITRIIEARESIRTSANISYVFFVTTKRILHDYSSL